MNASLLIQSCSSLQTGVDAMKRRYSRPLYFSESTYLFPTSGSVVKSSMGGYDSTSAL
jgi:hypothetical protein